MAARRRGSDPDQLAAAADEVWKGLGADDWGEAFAAHPRIGDRATSSRWSTQEQAGAADADAEVQRALLEGNTAYEDRFGHVFLIRATGRSAPEMLSALQERLANDPDTELTVAAEQQAEITRLRLDKLLREGGDGPVGREPKEAT
jgi:OHCU decarboxylase